MNADPSGYLAGFPHLAEPTSEMLSCRGDALYIEGVDVVALADRVATPFFLFSATQIDRNIAALRDSFRQFHPATRVFYVSKACSNLWFLDRVRRAGIAYSGPSLEVRRCCSMEESLTPMTVQYLVGLCCVRRNPDAVEIMLGDMVTDVAALKERDVDVTVTLQEEAGVLRAFKAYEVKREGAALDVSVIEQLTAKLDDMPTVTHRGIVSTSGFTDGAINKATNHGVELYSLRPWSRPEGTPMPTFSGEALPLQLRSIERRLLCWGKHSVYLHLASDAAEFTWEDQTEVYSRTGVPHSTYVTMGAFRDKILLRSTQALFAMRSAAKLDSLWSVTPISPGVAIEVTPLGPHTHTIDVPRDEAYLKFGDELAPIGAVSISGELEWHRSAAVPDFRIMERVPDGQPFAGAAIVPYGTPDDMLAALVFAPSSRKVGVHTIQLGERHRNAIRRLRLMTASDSKRAGAA